MRSVAHKYPPLTAARIAIRWSWGHRAGFAAYKRGVKFEHNAFEKLGEHMPMHEGWNAGWMQAGMILQEKAKR